MTSCPGGLLSSPASPWGSPWGPCSTCHCSTTTQSTGCAGVKPPQGARAKQCARVPLLPKTRGCRVTRGTFSELTTVGLHHAGDLQAHPHGPRRHSSLCEVSASEFSACTPGQGHLGECFISQTLRNMWIVPQTLSPGTCVHYLAFVLLFHQRRIF